MSKFTKKVVPLSDIKANQQNPRIISESKLKKLINSLLVFPKMMSLRPITVDGDMFVLGGNMRQTALGRIAQMKPKELREHLATLPEYQSMTDDEQQATVKFWTKFIRKPQVEAQVADGLTDDERQQFIIKDNVSYGDWDYDELQTWDEARLESWGLDMTMPDFGDLPQVVMPTDKQGDGESKPTYSVEEDDFDPEEVHETKVKRGEIWTLGEHRLMCGDSTDADAVAKLMNGERADLVFTDPPYGMKKESEGVLNDNLNFDDLLEFNKRWIPLTFANLKDNGSWYCWGIDEPLMDIYSNILRPMQKRNEITFRNFITWKKESDNPTMLYNGACSEGFRKYYSNEKCLFVMNGVQGFNINSDNYFDGWEPIRSYLAEEAERVGLTTNKQLQEICGVGMFAHWFTKSQWGLITEEHYKELQEFYKGQAFTKDYDRIKKDYDRIKKEWYATRAYFDAQPQNVDVWVYDVAPQEERTGHATPKPLALCARGIKTSSREDEIVLDVFGGSGSTMIACEQLGRKCRMMELDPHYCTVIIARWEKLTGQKAVKLNL